MRSITIAGLALLALSACSTSQMAQITAGAGTPAGQLFCQFETQGGGMIVAGLIDGAAAASGGAGSAAAILATGLLKADVDALCAQGAANVGAVAGIPVSPPAVAVGNVAVRVPAATSNRAAVGAWLGMLKSRGLLSHG